MPLILRLRGGLGNQMFQYASAKKISLENKENILIDDLTGFINDKEYKRKFQLDNFSIDYQKINKNIFFLSIYLLRIKIYYFLKKKLKFKIINYYDDDDSLSDLNFKDNRYIFLNGLWQNYKYFESIRKILIKEFSLKDLKINVDDYINNFDSSNHVAVHIRNYDKNKKFENNLPRSYYEKAFDYFGKHLDNPVFLIFSDDILYANKITNNLKYKVVINENKYPKKEILDFNLMLQFKNFIIANSTYSWWPAYLSDYPDKKILYPNKKSDMYHSKQWNFDLNVPKDWILI